MRREPLVSIITPVRDGARTIVTTLDSVLAQTETGWEHLVIDDGSTDATAAVVASAAHPRLFYERQAPAGVSAARNRALDLARGEFLLFLDADDWLLPNALRDHLAYLERHPECVVSVSDGHFCTDAGAPIAQFSARRGPIAPTATLAALLCNPGLIGAPLAAMVRAAVVRAHRIRFDPTLTIGEDTLFWIEMARHGSFGFLDAITCGYRWHAGNTTLRTSVVDRRAQLAQMANTVLAAPYFAEQAAAVRAAFIEQVLLRTLPDLPEDQARIIASPQFAALPAAVRARLLRLAAAEHLVSRRAVDSAWAWIREACRLAPRDRVARALAILLAVHPRLAELAIRMRRGAIATGEDPVWHYAHGAPHDVPAAAP